MTKPIDHAEASSEFIAASDHLAFHDKRLWDLRCKRDRATAAVPEWEELRTLASQIKEHTLTHLGHYLEQFERAAQANGVTVHWPATRPSTTRWCTTSWPRAARSRSSRASRCSPTSATCARFSSSAASR